jgi:pilus assembly protein CpaE
VSETRVVAVGPPPTFRQQVARALEGPLEDVEWMPSVPSAEGLLGEGAAAPHVLVLSPLVKMPDAVGLAEFVAQRLPSTAVILVRDEDPNGLLPIAMRAGIRDVVNMSRGSQELQEALRRAVAWAGNLQALRQATPEKPSRHGKVISVFSTKGGTGKTTLTCNLAVMLAEGSGEDTAVVDLDFDMGDVFATFGRQATGSLNDLISVVEAQDREAILARGTVFGEHLWGFGSVTDPAAQAPDGHAVGRTLRAFADIFAYVVVDASADYSDAALAAFDVSDTVCLIASLDVVSVRHLAQARDTLRSLGVERERLRLILNRVDSKVGLSVEDVERVMNLKVDATIPASILMPQSLNNGRPVSMAEPKSEVAASFRAIAQTFLPPPPPSVGRHRRSRRK